MGTAQYDLISIAANDLSRIKLPQFQRKLVWSKNKKDRFIETLHEGLPFGSILVYPENQNPDARLLIIDGQQRLSTIREFSKNRIKFWKPLNQTEYDASLNRINRLLDPNAQIDSRSFDELLSADEDIQFDWVNEIEGSETRKAVRNELEHIKRCMRDYIDLTHLSIPAIKFIGERTRIADVFSRLNQGGVALSKYEVFSAAWIHTEIKLDQSPLQCEMLANVKDYYASMSDHAVFDLDGFSEDELTQNRVVTLAELAIALGMYVKSHLKALAPQTDNKVVELGFGLLGVAADLDNRKLNQLIDHSKAIQTNLETILDKTERICTNLQDTFAKILKVVKSNKNDEYAQGISTSFKTLSYFAALWNLDPESNSYRNSLRNIKAYYLYDALTGAWGSAGDQRLLEYQDAHRKRDYLSPITQEDFIAAFNQWISSITPGGIYFSKETKAIITIHANLSYLATAVPNGENFELEHIIARKFFNDTERDVQKKLCGNSLGNCMFLPKGLNNQKKIKTLYEVNEDERYSKLIQESFYFEERDLLDAIEAIKRGDTEQANRIIRSRASLIGAATAKALLS